MASSSFYKFQSFVEAVAEKKHDFENDTFTLALTNAANPPLNTNSILANLTTITPYTNLSSRVLTVSGSSQAGGTYKCVINDITLTAGGGAVAPFRYLAIYNETAATDELVCYYDYGSDLTLADGESLLVDFDGAAGAFTIA